jgi:hypothetical protein
MLIDDRGNISGSVVGLLDDGSQIIFAGNR